MEKLTKQVYEEIKNSYVFHGSPKTFEKCLPHQAKCETKRPENEYNAIYASNKIDFAIMFAFNKIPTGKDAGWEADDFAKLYNMTIDEDAIGYIYCFNKSDFKPTLEGSIQYVSEIAKDPIITYTVAYCDFKHLFINLDKDFDNRNN